MSFFDEILIVHKRLCCNDLIDIWCFKLCCIQCSWHYDFSLDSLWGIANIPSLIKQLFLISQVGHGFHPKSLPILLRITKKNENLITKNYKFQTCNNILINVELRQTWFILHNLPQFLIQLWHMVRKARNKIWIVFVCERGSILSC
jgi:hypothetical protein